MIIVSKRRAGFIKLWPAVLIGVVISASAIALIVGLSVGLTTKSSSSSPSSAAAPANAVPSGATNAELEGRRLGVITPPSVTTPRGRILLMAILNSAGRITGEVCSGLSNNSLQNFEAQSKDYLKTIPTFGSIITDSSTTFSYRCDLPTSKTYWSVTMRIVSSEYGFSQTYLKTNVITSLQTKTTSFSIPGAAFETNPNFTYAVSGTISIKTGSSYVVDTCKNCEFSSDDKQTSGNRTETTSNEIPTILSSTSTKSTNTTTTSTTTRTTTSTSSTSVSKTSSSSTTSESFTSSTTAFLNLDPSVQSYCGLGTTNTKKILTIVGGNAAQKGDWGWQVRLSMANGGLCGGSLISSQWVLSAAHCVSSLDAAKYKITVGGYSVSTPDSWTLTNRDVSKVISHPNYNQNTFKNDLALFKLANPVTIDKTDFKIVPICVPISSARFQNNSGWATGWGTTSSGGSTSDVLLQVNLPILTDSACSNSIYSTNIDTTGQVCAGDGKGKDTCQGDSGGPLVAKDSDGRWYLVGVTSYGVGCGTNPGVYARPSAYQDWIISVLATN